MPSKDLNTEFMNLAYETAASIVELYAEHKCGDIYSSEQAKSLLLNVARDIRTQKREQK